MSEQTENRVSMTLLKDVSCCHKCKYGYLNNDMKWFFEDRPMCLYFHDTGKHRINDENHCKMFEEVTDEERKEIAKKNQVNYKNNFLI